MGDSKDGCIVDVASGCKNGYSCILDIYIVTYMHNNHTYDRTCRSKAIIMMVVRTGKMKINFFKKDPQAVSGGTGPA